MSLELNNGRFYTGEVDPAMLPNGFGKELYPSGEILYKGQFKHGKREGQGTFYYESGKAGYTGKFKADFMHGPGLLFYQDSGQLLFNGTMFEGNFKEGNLFFQNGTLSEKLLE